MRLSRKARECRAQIEEAFLFSRDDKGIAKYFGIPLYEVMALRQLFDEQLAEREAQTTVEKVGSANLKRAIDSMFRNWEREHGFKEGAAELLLPAGYHPMREAA
jgi:hypothetical protein